MSQLDHENRLAVSLSAENVRLQKQILDEKTVQQKVVTTTTIHEEGVRVLKSIRSD